MHACTKHQKMDSVFHYTSLLSLLLLVAVLVNHPPATTSAASVEEYTLDNIVDSPLKTTTTTRSPFPKKIRKGMRCTTAYGNRYNICNGVSANNGTSIIHCCKKHCRNVLSDKNNCGVCRHKCRFGQRCCGGACIDVLRNRSHCGKCSRKCPRGVACEYGVCGYA